MEDKVHISIPELDSEGLTYEGFFRVLFLLVKHEVAHLKDIYPSCSIDDIKAYPLQIAQRIVITSCTYIILLNVKKISALLWQYYALWQIHFLRYI